MSGLPNRPEFNETLGNLSARVEIYTARHCGYCVRAKRLLQERGLAFIEHSIDGDGDSRYKMMERAGGRRTLPQIFINDRAIGGYLELYQLDHDGQLDSLLREGATKNATSDREGS